VALLCTPSNVCFLGPTRVHIPRHLDRFSRFCTAHGRAFLYVTKGHPFPQNCPFPWGIWTLSNSRFFGSTRVHNPNNISISSAAFAGLTIVTDRQIRPRYIGNNRPCLRSSTAMPPMRPNNNNNNNKWSKNFDERPHHMGFYWENLT